MKKILIALPLLTLAFVSGCFKTSNPIKINADVTSLITNFEPGNKNDKVFQSAKRKRALEIFAPHANGNEILNLNVLEQAPFKGYQYGSPDIDALKRLHSFRSHLHRVSENSAQAYQKFQEQVLTVNSPGLYRNTNDLITDFENVSLRDGVKVAADWKEIMQLSGNDGIQIVNAYNYFFKHFGKENAKRWLFQLKVAPRFFNLKSGVLGVTYVHNEYAFQYINLINDAFNKALIDEQYEAGHFATNNVTSTINHELGHAFDQALLFKPNQLNLNYLPSQQIVFELYQKQNFYLTGLDSWHQKYPNVNQNAFRYQKFTTKDYIASPRVQFVLFIAEKLGYKETEIDFTQEILKSDFSAANEATKTAFSLSKLFVNSAYGRSSWAEHFAEIFSEWLLTPNMQPDRTKYSIRWKILNEFFLDYLPTFYNKAVLRK